MAEAEGSSEEFDGLHPRAEEPNEEPDVVSDTMSIAELWQQAITSDDRSLLGERLQDAFDRANWALGGDYELMNVDGQTAVWTTVVDELDQYAHVHGKVP
jgi:hypothetical protein